MNGGRADSLHRLAGMVGLAGALLFFVGDMLFYGYFGAGATFHQGMIGAEGLLRLASNRSKTPAGGAATSGR
jgi:hypothetical protein